jgi:hypothetical protein
MESMIANTQNTNTQSNSQETANDLTSAAMPSVSKGSPDVQVARFGKFTVIVMTVGAAILGAAKTARGAMEIDWLRNVTGYANTSDTNLHEPELDDGYGPTDAITAASVTLPSLQSGEQWQLSGVQGIGSEGPINVAPNGIWQVNVYSSTSAMLSNNGGDLYQESISPLSAPKIFDTQISNTGSGATSNAYFIQYDTSSLATPILLNGGQTYYIAVQNLDENGEWGFSETDMSSGFGPDPIVSGPNFNVLHHWTEAPGYTTGVEAVDLGFTDPAAGSVPEPTSLAMLTIGSIALLARRRRT